MSPTFPYITAGEIDSQTKKLLQLSGTFLYEQIYSGGCKSLGPS